MERIDIRRLEGTATTTTVLELKGPLTISTLFDFQDVVRQPDLGNVIVDLTEVPYIDSAGLGALLGYWAHTQRTGQNFALSGVSKRVQVLFEMTRTRTIIPLFSTPAEAQSSFPAGGASTAATA